MKVSTAQQMAVVAAAKKNHLAIQAEFSVAAAMDSAGQPVAPTFSLVGYTGAAIKQFWSRNPLVVDLAGMDTGSGVLPILYGHDASLDSVLGQSSTTINDGKQLVLAGDLFGASATSEQVLNLARRGMKFQASIGADINRIENISAGEKVNVNGREFAGPISVVRSSKLREVSIVLMGADPDTSAAIAAEASEDFHMADNATPLPADKVEAAAIVATEPKAPAAAPDNSTAILAELKALREEQAAQRAAIEAQAKVNAARSERPAGPAIHVVEGSVASPKVIEAALCLQAGLRAEKSYDEQTLEAAHKARRDVSLSGVFVQAARANGYTGSDRLNDGNMRAVITAAFASHQISDLLSAVVNKFLLNGFNSVESVWQQISSVRSVNDFKAINQFRLNGDFKFKKVGNGGELKTAIASDSKRSLSADTYGITTQITRQDMYNDDLNALSQVPQRMGRGSSLALNETIWTEFAADNATYYQKVTAAAGNALTLAGLKIAATAFRKLTDPDGNPLGIAPRVLLVPPELELAAAELMTSNFIISGNTTPAPSANVLQGRYRVVVSNYLTSATTWWLLADGADLPAMDVVFLNGQQAPTVENVMPDADKLGVTVKGYMDFGVAKAEPLSCLRMAVS
jgi:phage major head subunit gpT-like protein